MLTYADVSDCEIDDTRSTLDLYINLETNGTLFTCFTADVCWRMLAYADVCRSTLDLYINLETNGKYTY